MTTNPLNEMYFIWLQQQMYINYRHNSPVKFDELLKILWEKPFPWTVEKDDNRVEDGLELRYHFLQDESCRYRFQALQIEAGDSGMLHIVADFRAQPCSILEVIIGLSRRLAFAAAGEPGWWAWRLIVNLDLQRMKDPLTQRRRARIEETLEALIWRTYTWDGVGGFFPLRYPKEDQRKVELWYQMSAYLEEFSHN